jgi:hypothetical protein
MTLIIVAKIEAKVKACQNPPELRTKSLKARVNESRSTIRRSFFEKDTEPKNNIYRPTGKTRPC